MINVIHVISFHLNIALFLSYQQVSPQRDERHGFLPKSGRNCPEETFLFGRKNIGIYFMIKIMRGGG